MSKNAFSGCKFCGGQGCLACEGERKKAKAKQLEPIFVAKLDNPHDMELLKTYFGKEALNEAFAEGGGGIRKIEQGAAIASFLQVMYKEKETRDEVGKPGQERTESTGQEA